MKCQICGTELRFLEYGHKIGKNGKPAKWPIYEKCPNIANHRSLMREKAPASAPKERPQKPAKEVTVPEGIPTTRELGIGMSFMWEENRPPTKEDILAVVRKYAARTGNWPISARCNLRSYDLFFSALADQAIDLKADLDFTLDWPRLDIDL